MSFKLPLENAIYEILRKKNNLSEDELIEELHNYFKISKKNEEAISKKEVYKALMRLELIDKILVINQRDNKIIMLKDYGSRSS
ncbi:MAG: hypothetical protein RQ952_06515 [Thermoproteota archaeon]|jgi:hypothetical protein|nr:hypothetical protein [Thermoproteota archaeon]